MSKLPLISVVIPCYNHARYLPEAVASVKIQSYQNFEIIIVDDGSTDDTKAVCETLAGTKYIFQRNQGLSAARNTGIDNAQGDYFVFLDADDYLFPDALRLNVHFLQGDPRLAFVSGAHEKVDAKKQIIREDPQPVIKSDHYRALLEGNYIGMHATVMYTRWILSEFRFDTNLRACEDYDLYFRIARKYPVANHGEKIAAYRIHGNNMSANIPFMLDMVLKVQGAQEPLLKNDEERKSFQRGIAVWKDYYEKRLYHVLKDKFWRSKQRPSDEELAQLEKLSPALHSQLKKQMMKQEMKSLVKKVIPDVIISRLNRIGLVKQYTPPVGTVSFGDLERAVPISRSFGYERGGPVDRFYIENFLRNNTQIIKGRAFEIGDNAYTKQFGGANVEKSDVLHVYQANDSVTFLGDLTDAPHIPSDIFDCIILTQTLHLIYDYKAALRTCHRILKPGGTLLATVPGITNVDPDEWKEFWLWAFTDTAMRKVFAETFPGANIEIKTYGNVYIATAFLYGLGLPEINKDLLEKHDPSYQVIISIKATK